MKRILFLLLLISAGLSQTAHAQKLFTFGKHHAPLSEFERQFYKNNPKESITKDTARYYLDLFVNFKLKVQQAKDLGMDTAAVFLQEMGHYKKQLAQPYMVDTSATESLISEAYSHLKEEVKVSHIMVKIGYDALPKDTLVAYKKALDIKKKLKHEPFDSVAVKYSEDQSAKDNYGSLGYFTAFDMIYPFESAAYNTKVGSIAGPFRTQFGYHIIKVFDRRAARGKIKAAHLLIRLDENAKDEEILRAKQRADSIYAEIKAGKGIFDEMVTTYSDDVNTKGNGGQIGWIESTNRKYPKDFREAIFKLNKDGAYSLPIKTPYGFHIVKRIEHKGVAPKDSLYNELKQKVSNPRDERYGISKQVVINRIKKEYGFKENKINLAAFTAKTDSTLLLGRWTNADHKNLNLELFTLGKKSFDEHDFSKFIELNQQTALKKTKKMIVDGLYNSFVDQYVWEYEVNNLANKYDKYRYLIQEYNNGILLFNLSEKRIWNKGITDTTGLKKYYQANKTSYMWNKRVDATIYECQSKDICKKVSKWVKKGKADTTISRMAHQIHPLSLVIKNGKYEKEDHPVLSMKWKKGRRSVEIDGKHYVVVIHKVLPSKPKELNEVRGPVTSNYQNKLEKEWIIELKKQYPVTIHQQVLDGFLNKLPK